MLTVWNTNATYSSDRQQGSSEVFVVDYPWPWRYKKNKKDLFLFLFYCTTLGTPDTDGCVHCILPYFLGAFLSLSLHATKVNISTGETWVNKCVKAPYALSVKALRVTLGGKITCCKNTVNSTAECAEEKKKLALLLVGSLQLYWVIRQTRTATLTFSDLYVESSTVGLRGGGEPAKARDQAVKSSLVCIKNLTEDCTQSRSANQPVSFLPVWKPFVQTEAQNRLSVGERGAFIRGACNALFPFW